MRGENPPNSHELAKLEAKVKLMHFLKDLGIKAAIPASRDVFLEYMELVSEIIGATDVS